LPQRWQKVLWHLDVDGRKPREVAPMLDMKPNSVSALAYRAREGLRKAYLEQHILAKGESLAAACQDVRHRLVAFVRASANKSEAAKVESHLQTCARCTSAYHELEELNSHIGAVSGGLALSFAIPAVAGHASGFAGHMSALAAKATFLGKTIVAAGSTAAVMVTSATVLNLPLELPAGAETTTQVQRPDQERQVRDRTTDPTDGRTLEETATTSTDTSMSSTTDDTGQDQTPGSTPSQGPSSGGSQPVTVSVNGTKASASVDAVGVKVDASVDLKKPLETRVTVKAGNLDIDTDKVTKKVTQKVTQKVTNKVTEKVTKKVTEKLDQDRDAD